MHRLVGMLGWLVLLGAGLASSAIADGARQGCQFPGSWFGFNTVTGYADWMSVADGVGNLGNYTLETVVDAETLKALFPYAIPVRHSTFRGNWKRLNGNTFEITVISIVYDSSSQPVGIAQINARDTLDSTCNTMYIEPELKLYTASQDPFVDVPFFQMPLTNHYGNRMGVDPYTE